MEEAINFNNQQLSCEIKTSLRQCYLNKFAHPRESSRIQRSSSMFFLDNKFHYKWKVSELRWTTFVCRLGEKKLCKKNLFHDHLMAFLIANTGKLPDKTNFSPPSFVRLQIGIEKVFDFECYWEMEKFVADGWVRGATSTIFLKILISTYAFWSQEKKAINFSFVPEERKFEFQNFSFFITNSPFWQRWNLINYAKWIPVNKKEKPWRAQVKYKKE